MRNKHLGYKNKQIVAKYQNRMCSRYVVDFQYSQWGQLLLIFEGFSSIIFYDGKHTTSIYQYTFTKHTSSKYIFLLHMSCGCLVSLFLIPSIFKACFLAEITNVIYFNVAKFFL